MTSSKYTYAQLAAECEREADMRRGFYKRQRPGADYTPTQKARIEMMDLMAVHFRELAEKHPPAPPAAVQTDLLGGV